MKRALVAICFVAATMAVGATVARAAENLAANPGFEQAATINVDKDLKSFIDQGVDLPKGEAVALPAVWRLNASDGWTAQGKNLFRYVVGEAGKDVHEGTHAVRISTDGRAAIFTEAFIPVAAESGANKNVLLQNKPNKFSIWAKGKGQFQVYAYTYLTEGENYSARKVVPDAFTVTDTWQKYEGTIEFTNPKVNGARPVIAVVGGDITVDDVAFSGQD